MLSENERVFLVLRMAELKSVTLVRRAWKRKFQSSPPTPKTITRVYQKFVSTGSVSDLPKSGREADEDIARGIEQHFNENPSQSTRKAAQIFNVSHTTVRRALKAARMKAYKIHPTQALSEDDFCDRLEMCSELLELFGNNEDICFSDEATFHTSGHVHRQNCRVWGYENPHATHQVIHQSPKVNVWCALRKGQLFGPYFFDGNVTSEKYQHMLESFFLPQLSQHQKDTMFFQQDGAPPHWGLRVRGFLNAKFPDRWIGRDGPIHWAARSPDLTPLDFFLWGHVKSQVYRPNVSYSTVEDLKTEIRRIIQEIGEDVLTRVVESVPERYRRCVENGGRHVEQFD